MNSRPRFVAFRNSLLIAIALLPLIPATSRSKFAQDAQQKTATSGLSGVGPVVQGTPDDPLRDTHETHLRHVKQLTFGGQNAEAYFSYDGKRLIFMSTREPYQCDQIYIMNIDGSNVHLLSTGRGRTTCGYFYADGSTYSIPRRIAPATIARRAPIIRMAMSGRFIRRIRFITPPMTAKSTGR